MPNEWVTSELLSVLTGWTKGRIRSCREKSWRQGREYLLVASTGEPKQKSEAMYNLPAINQWIAKQAANQPKI